MGVTLIAFDFDGTLSDSEMIVRLGERAGAADEIERVTRRAMNDEIGYAESLRERASTLAGLSDEHAERAFRAIELRPGAGSLIDDLRAAGHEVVVLTGGFERGVERALASADTAVDGVVANRLPIADGALTGDVAGPLVEGTKDDALRAAADERGTSLDDCIAVGDGANDLPMLTIAGLAIGYEPKPAVRPACDESVDSMVALRSLFERRGLL